MSGTGGIADRHLLPVQGCQASTEAATKLIRILVDENWAATVAGQLLVSCLVNLLARQVGLVRRIEIVCVKTRLRIRLPGAVSPQPFPDCLADLASWAVGGAIEVSIGLGIHPVDLTILIGWPGSQLTGAPSEALCAVGDGWRAWVGTVETAPSVIAPSSLSPLGPLLAAALLAGEVFKHSRGLVRGRFLTSQGYSLWSGKSSADFRELDDGPAIEGAELPACHIVGAGAVGNALAYVASYLNLSHGYFVTIDDDRYDGTNLNRCLLAGWNDRGDYKVHSVVRALRDAGLDGYPFTGSIKSYLSDLRPGLREDVARAVDALQFGAVVSCVDKGASRQDVQGLRPRLLVGGSTLNLQAKMHHYGARSGSACLGCFNPAERDGERIRALEVQLRTMPPEERRNFLKSKDLPVDAIEEYLSGVPCGGIGEAALKSFAVQSPPEFSVGFVSLGSGLLLIAELLKSTYFSATGPHRAEMMTLNFLNGGLLDARYAADSACELKCQK